MPIKSEKQTVREILKEIFYGEKVWPNKESRRLERKLIKERGVSQGIASSLVKRQRAEPWFLLKNSGLISEIINEQIQKYEENELNLSKENILENPFIFELMEEYEITPSRALMRLSPLTLIERTRVVKEHGKEANSYNLLNKKYKEIASLPPKAG